MTNPLFLVIPFVLSAVIVLLLTPPVRRLLVRLGLVDRPSARRINKTPIPRGGGLALFTGVAVTGILWRFLTNDFAPWASDQQFWMFVLAAVLMVIVGIVDDAVNLKPVVKLAGQIVVATIIYYSGISIDGAIWFDIPPVLDYIFTVGWFVVIVNAFNLIDGMDGLASGLALIGSVGMTVCLVSRGRAGDCVPLVILAGACLGFLRYNFNPASVFLGDCGSMFLGFVLATIPLLTGGKSAFFASIGVPLLVMGVPLFDTVLAIWRRSMRAALPSTDGKHGLGRIMQPDMEHLHHRFLASGLSQRRAAWALYLVSIVMVLVAIGMTVFTNRSTGIILIGTLIIIVIMARHLSRVELWDTGRAFLNASHSSQFTRCLVPLYVVADILFLLLAWRLSFSVAFAFPDGFHLGSSFPVFLMSIMFMMLITGIYRRVWNKSDVRDFAMLIVSVASGWCLGFAVSILLEFRYYGFNRQTTAFLFLSFLPIVLIRVCRLLISNALSVSETLRLANRPESRRVLVYGAGEHFAMLDVAMHGSMLGSRTQYVVALIDDNTHLRGRLVRGVRVAGGVNEIEQIIADTNPSEILIAASLRPENYEKVFSAAQKHGIILNEWQCGIKSVVPVEKDGGK